jgi:hypothetical protein
MSRTFTVHLVRRHPPPAPLPDGRARPVRIKNVDLTCDSCGHRWDAVQGLDLEPMMGGVGVFCPVCRSEGLIHRIELER